MTNTSGVRPKDLADFLRDLATGGWDVRRTARGHFKLTPPGGGRPVFAPGTCSDVRGVKNLRAECRRVAEGRV